jgi:hypothetical protein
MMMMRARPSQPPVRTALLLRGHPGPDPRNLWMAWNGMSSRLWSGSRPQRNALRTSERGVGSWPGVPMEPRTPRRRGSLSTRKGRRTLDDVPPAGPERPPSRSTAMAAGDALRIVVPRAREGAGATAVARVAGVAVWEKAAPSAEIRIIGRMNVSSGEPARTRCLRTLVPGRRLIPPVRLGMVVAVRRRGLGDRDGVLLGSLDRSTPTLRSLPTRRPRTKVHTPPLPVARPWRRSR